MADTEAEPGRDPGRGPGPGPDLGNKQTDRDGVPLPGAKHGGDNQAKMSNAN